MNKVGLEVRDGQVLVKSYSRYNAQRIEESMFEQLEAFESHGTQRMIDDPNYAFDEATIRRLIDFAILTDKENDPG